MAMTEKRLQVDRLGRRIPGTETWLLNDVSLSLDAGERLAISGASGSGKSLLMRALALLDPISVGELVWHGSPVSDAHVPKFRSEVMYLSQRPATLGTVVGEILQQPYSLSLHRSQTFDRERIVRWLSRLGRDESFFRQKATDLSGGERQIVALLRVLQLDPSVILLDEPTAALDPKTARTIEHLLTEWYDEQPTERSMIWIGHDDAACRRMAPRQGTMRAGQFFEEPSA